MNEKLKPECHTTQSECDFIRRLGTFSENGARIGKRALLEGYIKSHSKRNVWDNVDHKQAYNVARRELAKIIADETDLKRAAR